MKRRHRVLLLVLGLLDLAVVVALGLYLWGSLRPSSPILMEDTTAERCSHWLLEALPPHLSPAVSWDEDHLYVYLTAFYASASPPESNAQLLWTALDGVSHVLRIGCPPPPSVSLFVTARGSEEETSHVVHLPPDELAAWARGELTADELATSAAYRRVTPRGAFESPPPPSLRPR